MTKEEESKQEYRTFKEYQEHFFPSSKDEPKPDANDPYNMGVIMARESLSDSSFQPDDKNRTQRC